MLLEVEVKLALLKEAYLVMSVDAEDQSAQRTLRLLALPYADHSDFDEAWRP